MPLLPPAKRIDNKHKGQLPKMPNQQKVNSILKEIVKEAGITRQLQMADTSVNRSGLKSVPLYEKISFHSARRSFATNVYQSGVMSLGELMSLTGHESEASLMVYLEVTREDVSKRRQRSCWRRSKTFDQAVTPRCVRNRWSTSVDPVVRPLR